MKKATAHTSDAVRLRSRFHIAAALPVLFLVSQAVFAAEGKLNLSVEVNKGTCSITMPSRVMLGSFIANDFTDNGGTVHIQPFDLTLSDCTGPDGGVLRPGILVTGKTLPGSDDTVFSDDTSHQGDANAAGFMLKEGHYTGSLTGYRTAPGTVKDKEITSQGRFQPGEIPADGTVVPYTVGLVSAGTPQAGEVRAVVTFEVKYQ